MEQYDYIPSIGNLRNNVVDLQIRIRKDGSEFLADIMENRRPFDELSIPLTESDLREINEDIRDEVSSLTDQRGNPAKSYDRALYDLAKVGHGAFNQVFGHGHTLDVIEDLLLKRSDITHIQITSKDFHLPWELLYPASLDLPISANRFLGMRYVLARTIPVPYDKNRPNLAEIETTRPKIGLLCDESLHAVKEIEIRYFVALHQQKIIEISQLSRLDPELTRKRLEFSKFKSFFLQDLDIAHFACHAEYDLNHPNASHFILSDNFSISIREMREYDMTINGSPIVIFNACKTGAISPLSTSSLAIIFYRLGAKAVLATEANIPDSFASEFTTHLYSHLLSGETIGNSLFLTRREFALGEEKQLWGLLYSLYGPHAIRFALSKQFSQV